MLRIKQYTTHEMLDFTLEQVNRGLKCPRPEDEGLRQLSELQKSERMRLWALRCAADLWATRDTPEGFALMVLSLLGLGVFVGTEVQKRASEVGTLEDWFGQESAPSTTA